MNNYELMSLCDVIFAIRYNREKLYETLLNDKTVSLLHKYFGQHDYTNYELIRKTNIVQLYDQHKNYKYKFI